MDLAAMTIQGGALIGAILLLRVLGRYRLPAWTFRVLWGVALARLLIPIALPFPWNVYTALERLPAPAEAGTAVSIPSQAVTPAPGLPALSPEPAPTVEPAAAGLEIPWLTLLWLAGAVLLAAVFLAGYRRGLRRFRTALPFRHPAVEAWRRRHPRLEGVPVRTCASISSPLTYGLLRPVILLPPGLEGDSGEELGYVLLHEGAHILSRDAWWKLFLAAALCVHWFNPLVWCMYLCANRDLERCCDEQVVRTCGLDARRAYALTLLKWEERRSGFLPLCSNFGTPILKERVIFIMKLRKQSAVALALALTVVAGTTAAFATSPAPRDGDQTRVSQDIPSSASSAVQPSEDIFQTNEGPAAPVQTPAPETSTPDQVLPAAPVTEPESVPAQEPAQPQAPESQAPVQTEDPFASRWDIPEGELPEGLEIPVADREEREALADYLHQVRGIRQGDLGYVTYDDGRMAVTVTYVKSNQEARFWEEHPTGEYPVNSKGETYGALGYREYVGEAPDLVGVVADNGERGYIPYDDYVRGIHLGYPGDYNSAEEMAAYEDWCKLMPTHYAIPVYDVEHEQVVGQFFVYNPDGYDRTPESIEEELETVAGTLRNTLGWSGDEIQEFLQAKRAEYYGG